MAALRSDRLNGYVLLESMIAMVIVMLCFAVATVIYNNVVNGSRYRLKVIARLELEAEAFRTKQEKIFLDETIEADEFSIERRIIPYPGTNGTVRLLLEAYAPDHHLLSRYEELLHP